MHSIVCLQPRIPQNIGNIGRTVVALGYRLILIKPYGFVLDSRYVKRASVQHWENVQLTEYETFEEFLSTENPGEKCFFVTEHGAHNYKDVEYPANSYFVFGPESEDYPRDVIERFRDRTVYLPMPYPDQVDCLNLSNVVAIMAYHTYP